jgi:hypothetical protein
MVYSACTASKTPAGSLQRIVCVTVECVERETWSNVPKRLLGGPGNELVSRDVRKHCNLATVICCSDLDNNMPLLIAE